MVGIERLDEDELRGLSQRADQLGIVSVYVNADPRQDPNLQASAIDLRNRFRELEHRLRENTGARSGRDVPAALQRLWPEVEDLTRPGGSGLGRIAFFALDSDWRLRLDTALPVVNRLVLDEGPFIHPLLELLDEGRPAGVVLVSPDAAELLEWRLGVLEPVGRVENDYVQAPHERAGQLGGGPRGQYNTPMREQRQAREQDRVERFLDDVADVVAGAVTERRWERVLISGGTRWTEPTVQRLPQPHRDKVIRDPRVLGGLEAGALADAVTERVHAHHKEQEQHVVERMRDAGRSGSGALGLSEVAVALNSGRVAHLVYDPQVRYAGTLGADGALYSPHEVPPGEPAGSPEPRFTERLVERALDTSARISPVEGAAAGSLRDADGIAALLRW